MKVVCVDNTIGNSRYFKLYNIYESKDLSFEDRNRLRLPYDYIIVEAQWCNVVCFMPLDEWRKKRLDNIGI